MSLSDAGLCAALCVWHSAAPGPTGIVETSSTSMREHAVMSSEGVRMGGWGGEGNALCDARWGSPGAARGLSSVPRTVAPTAFRGLFA